MRKWNVLSSVVSEPHRITKKPTTPFGLYLKNFKGTTKLSIQDIAKQWNNFTDEEKKPYYDQFNKDYKVFSSQFKKQILHQPFAYFMKLNYKKIYDKLERPGYDWKYRERNKLAIREVSKLWKSLSIEERNKITEEAAAYHSSITNKE